MPNGIRNRNSGTLFKINGLQGRYAEVVELSLTTKQDKGAAGRSREGERSTVLPLGHGSGSCGVAHAVA